jgi:hypothetical protein
MGYFAVAELAETGLAGATVACGMTGASLIGMAELGKGCEPCCTPRICS